ncbi:MAG: hypothetical protein QXR26_01490 [Candidatus Caldarchaeum sp.]
MITFSMPIFSVSVFPTMQSSFGLILASLYESSTLERVETATGQLGPSQKAKYSPGTSGQVCSLVSKAQLNDLACVASG